MLNTFLRLYDGFSNPQPPRRRTSPAAVNPTRSTSPPEAIAHTLRPVQNWSHPFRDKGHSLSQLTQLSKAAGGYYPLGRNALWHGGVHFDSGTAGVMDHSSVHCLADGEVVAYRIDQHSPTTSYITQGACVPKPFSRNFVLIRHRLQLPEIEGCTDTPPSLVFYSLYMHLQDWAVYQSDSTLTRPMFWPEGATRRVKQTVNDVRAGPPERRGLNVRNQAHQGKAITLLPKGKEVIVSGEGEYRKLENTTGPDHLKDDEGSLLGYLSIHHLEPIDGGQFRVKGRELLKLHAEADGRSRVINTLPSGTQVTVSGEGEFRKLEHINQYVHFPSLQASKEPLAHDRIVVLDEPVAIKAGDLIGHLGLYHEGSAEHPEQKLHLEVISGEGVDDFINASRAWADRLPATEKTSLKLAKGTPVVPHQDHYSATRYPILATNSPVSGADLLIPKILLDDLPTERKIAVAKAGHNKAYNWYRLDGLLNDADNNRLDGWVREEVGVTQWVSPWSWEGYEVIFSYDTPRESLAAYLRDLNRLTAAQLERYGPVADEADNGPIKKRLYDIIDRNRDGKITADELQAAIHLPAHAQSISQLIIHCESEWYYKPRKWDLLDELLGHSGSTPHLNWLAEKERIREISWWAQVAEKVGLPGYGEAYHFHPVGLMGNFCTTNDDNDFKWLKVPYGQLTFDVEGNDIENESHPMYRYFSRVVHWPGGASGITIGRGYDLGQQPNPEEDLHNAGIEEPLLSWLISAKRLQGADAKKYMADAKANIRKHRITRKQQHALFLPVYEYMRIDIIRISDEKFNSERYGKLNWSSISSKIQDILVDLRYRGDYGPTSRTYIQEHFTGNNLEMIRNIISSRTHWKNVPEDRFIRRREHLK